MRTAYRVLSTAVAVGAIFPFGTLPAHADTSPVQVETSAWFWSTQVTGEAAGGVGFPAGVPTQASDVPQGDLAVAYKPTNEKEKLADGSDASKPDKETYLMWDVYFIPEGSFVDSFTFTLFLDPNARQVTSPRIEPPAAAAPAGGQPEIIACVPTIGFGEAFGESFKLKPTDDCSNALYGAYDDKTKSYTFDASTYAQDWVDGKDNFGLAIRPAVDEQAPFQLVFKGAKDVKASITYTPAEPQAEEPPVVAPPIVNVPLPPAPPVGNSGYVPPAPVPQPRPQVQPVPQPVVVQTRAPQVISNVAATPLTSTRGLSPAFWFALVGGVMLLGATSLILGDPLEATASRGRVGTAGRHRGAVPAGVPARTTGTVRPRTV